MGFVPTEKWEEDGIRKYYFPTLPHKIVDDQNTKLYPSGEVLPGQVSKVREWIFHKGEGNDGIKYYCLSKQYGGCWHRAGAMMNRRLDCRHTFASVSVTELEELWKAPGKFEIFDVFFR